VGGGETAVSIVGNDSGGTAVCIVGNGGGETAVSGVATAVFGNKVWGNGRPIVSRQCRTATLSALQIKKGETARGCGIDWLLAGREPKLKLSRLME
jgi:hypothetical protein